MSCYCGVLAIRPVLGARSQSWPSGLAQESQTPCTTCLGPLGLLVLLQPFFRGYLQQELGETGAEERKRCLPARLSS